MLPIAQTPEPPYYAVVFTSHPGADQDGYAETAHRMVALASRQPGFLGIEAAGSDPQIVVSYWRDAEAIRAWKAHAEHQLAQRLGRERWYGAFRVRVCKVER
ncbi:MAG TPA: antibiotic biosynthesis monooxygenase, partial [Burkholderiaceae bacterium]|nr:antibiotic biosynthesis monooxygenase [Burkholderiaceae bacterium]